VAANQDIPLEVHISSREDHQNGKECCVETLKKISLSRDLCKLSFLKKTRFYVPICCLYLNKAEKHLFLYPILRNGSLKMLDNGGNHAKLKCVQPQPSPFWSEFVGKIYQTWNPGIRYFSFRGIVSPGRAFASFAGTTTRNELRPYFTNEKYGIEGEMENKKWIRKIGILIAAGLSFLVSVFLWFSGDKEAGLYVGLWVPSILSFGALMEAGK
jgi:hypothetical protein